MYSTFSIFGIEIIFESHVFLFLFTKKIFFGHTMWHLGSCALRGIEPVPPAVEMLSLNH